MNYYKRHLGDYARDTGHLTALEHGIYNLLLDWYYINERPIPADKAIRIAKGNREETETVLSEFFLLCDGGWRHCRADREIADYQRRAAINKETGKLGGRPKKTESVFSGNPIVTLATSHKPLATKELEASLSPDGAEPCPHEAILDLYHRLLPANPRIKVWDTNRKAALRARWREEEKRQRLAYWENLFSYIADSAFLTGKVEDRNGRPFLPGLDWIVKSANFAKIIEGRYHPRNAA